MGDWCAGTCSRGCVDPNEGASVNELGPFNVWELLVVTVVVSVLLGALGVLLGRRRLRRGIGKSHNDVMVASRATAAVIYAVLLAFTVVAVWEQYTSAKGDVASEASRLETLYRETQAMPPAERMELRALIRQYTDAVIAVEWKAQLTGGTSSVARHSLVQMYEVLGRQPPSVANTAVSSQYLSDLSALASERATRIDATKDALPWVLWLALIVGGIVVIAAGGLLYMQDTHLHIVISCAIAGLIGVLLFSTLVLDRPFHGALGIKPDDFKHAMVVYNSVDTTPTAAVAGTRSASVMPA
jgi:hypothetical protein